MTRRSRKGAKATEGEAASVARWNDSAHQSSATLKTLNMAAHVRWSYPKRQHAKEGPPIKAAPEQGGWYVCISTCLILSSCAAAIAFSLSRSIDRSPPVRVSNHRTTRYARQPRRDACPCRAMHVPLFSRRSNRRSENNTNSPPPPSATHVQAKASRQERKKSWR